MQRNIKFPGWSSSHNCPHKQERDNILSLALKSKTADGTKMLMCMYTVDVPDLSGLIREKYMSYKLKMGVFNIQKITANYPVTLLYVNPE